MASATSALETERRFILPVHGRLAELPARRRSAPTRSGRRTTPARAPRPEPQSRTRTTDLPSVLLITYTLRPNGGVSRPTSTATTVRTSEKGGEPLSTDGPYAETKEVLTGFFLLECADLDEAIARAATIPAAWNGGAIEVRPVIPMM